MKLNNYLHEQDISSAAFGEAVGVTQVTIGRYMKGQRIPTRDVMQKIIAATGGEVTPNDFFSEDAA
jgi:transcriptional regulator with XRE-family HTH domain